MSDTVRRLRDARNWLNNGNCCGDKDSYGICAAPACIFGEALKELYDAADRIDTLEAENKALREDAKRIYWAGAKDMRELLAEKMIAFGKSVHTEALPEFPARALLAKGDER